MFRRYVLFDKHEVYFNSSCLIRSVPYRASSESSNSKIITELKEAREAAQCIWNVKIIRGVWDAPSTICTLHYASGLEKLEGYHCRTPNATYAIWFCQCRCSSNDLEIEMSTCF